MMILINLLILLLLTIITNILADDIWKPLDLSSKLKILIVQVDSRQLEIEDPVKASYITLAAVLNHNYAKKHGYDFLFVHPSIDIKTVEEKFNVNEPPSESLKDPNVKTSAFHTGFKRFRGASWNKIPALWHILTTKGSDYDLILYVDSDLAVTSANAGKSIVDMYMHWRNSQDVRWGLEDITKSGMLFFSNSPYGDWEPCLAAFFLRPKLAIPMLLEWWNFDYQQKDYTFQYEQDVAWKMYQWEDQNVFSFNKSSTSMLKEWIHPVGMTVNEWCFNKGWLCHATAQWTKDRHRIFRTMFREEKEESKQEEGDELKNKFRSIVKEIKETEVQLNILPVAEAMEMIATSEKNKKLYEMQQKAVADYFKKEGQPPPPPPEETKPASSSSSSGTSSALSTDMKDIKTSSTSSSTSSSSSSSSSSPQLKTKSDGNPYTDIFRYN